MDYTDFKMAEFEKDILTEKIIGICFKVHSTLGPGFPERVYHNAIVLLLRKEGIQFESEKEFDVIFENKKVGIFRCDLFIENKLLLELKSVQGIMPVLFRNKLISYLRASNVKTGLLINFGNVRCDVKRLSV